ncbi:MAG: S26 family signal peptidase, partial [Christensenellales bacterium]
MKKSKRVFKLVCNVTLICILVVLCAFIGGTVYSRITGKSFLPYSVLWVLTDSMEPTIPSRSYILVRNVTADEIEVNDVITFSSKDPA